MIQGTPTIRSIKSTENIHLDDTLILNSTNASPLALKNIVIPNVNVTVCVQCGHENLKHEVIVKKNNHTLKGDHIISTRTLEGTMEDTLEDVTTRKEQEERWIKMKKDFPLIDWDLLEEKPFVLASFGSVAHVRSYYNNTNLIESNIATQEALIYTQLENHHER